MKPFLFISSLFTMIGTCMLASTISLKRNALADGGRVQVAQPIHVDADGQKQVGDSNPPWLSFDVIANDTANNVVFLKLPKESDWLISDSTFDQPIGNNIPKLLNKVNLLQDNFENSFGQWSTGLKDAHKSWKEMNPDYKIRYFNLYHCREYLKRYFHPSFLEAFDIIEAFEGKVDIFRFLIVYREGGWYSDWNEVCLVKDLLNKLGNDNHTTFFATNDNAHKGLDGNGYMQAAFFGAAPLNPVIAETIKEIFRNVQRSIHGENSLIQYESAAFGNGYTRATKMFENLQSSTKIGAFVAPYFSYEENNINLHECNGCGQDQSWSDREQTPQPDVARQKRKVAATRPPWLTFDALVNDTTTKESVVQKVPIESDWLIDEKTFVNPGKNIPKLLNKINVLRHGNFESTFGKWSTGLKEAHKSWKEMNPDYKIRYFNLYHCREYLKRYYHPDFLRAFDCIEAFAGKVDFFGFLVVYREGGWYSDWKEVCLVDDLLNKLGNDNHTTFFAAKDHGHSEMVGKGYMQAAFFGASPRHPVIAETIKEILNNVKRSYYGADSLAPTGPGAFGKGYANARSLLVGDYYKNSAKIGIFVSPFFSYKSQKINLHKCKGCGEGQSWSQGNDYNKKYAAKEYYCPDVHSLFRTQTYHEERKIKPKRKKIL